MLADEAIAATLKLEPTQREAIGKLIERLGTEGAAGSEDEHRVAQANLEREIVAQLSQTAHSVGRDDGQRRRHNLRRSNASTRRHCPSNARSRIIASPAVRVSAVLVPADSVRGPMITARRRAVLLLLVVRPPAALLRQQRVPPFHALVWSPQRSPRPPVRNLKDVKLKFQFRFTPWKDVLDWMATQSEMSLVAENPPQGTFNYTDNKEYTPDEAINLLNSVLLTKGFTLIRRDRMLILWNIADGRPPDSFVPQILAADLDKFGEFEMLGCLFALKKLTPEEAAPRLNPLKGPQGAIVILPKSRQIHVTELAGKLRTMRAASNRPKIPWSTRMKRLT